MTRKNRMLTAAAVAAVAIGSAAVAEDRSEASRVVVSATDILDGDVTNGLNTVAKVDGLVLDEQSETLAYVVLDAEPPVWEFLAGDGYVPADAVGYARGVDRANLEIRAEPSAAEGGAPDRIAITEEEAQRRLIDQILRERLAFADQQDRAIDDLLLDPETGEVTHFVVRIDDGRFMARRLALPAAHVERTAEGFAADLTLAEVESAPTRALEIL